LISVFLHDPVTIPERRGSLETEPGGSDPLFTMCQEGKMSHRISQFGLVLSLFIAGRVAVADGDTTYQLAYHFEPNQFLHYEQFDRVELTTQNANNKTLAVQQTQTLKSYRIVSVDEDGGAIIEPMIERVRMASKTADQTMVGYDSTKDEVIPKGYENLAGTIGRPLARFHLTPTGRLVKVTLLVKDVPKKFIEAAEKTDPSINFLVVLPENPVKAGDKWKEKFETRVSVGNKLTQDLGLIRVFELASVENDIATIRFRTSVRTAVNDPEILRQIIQQTPSGTVEFDLKAGRILNRSLQIDEKVIGAFGAQTLLHARGEVNEKQVPLHLEQNVSSVIPGTKAN
jgi:hypothetical protein